MRAILSNVQTEAKEQRYEIELIDLTQQVKNLRMFFIEEESLESFMIKHVEIDGNMLQFKLPSEQLEGSFPGQIRFDWELYLRWEENDHFETVQVENEFVANKQLGLNLFQRFETDFSGYVNIEVYHGTNADLFELKNVQHVADGILLFGTKQINEAHLQNIVMTVQDITDQKRIIQITKDLSRYSDLFVFKIPITELIVGKQYKVLISYKFNGESLEQRVGITTQFDPDSDFVKNINGSLVCLDVAYDNMLIFSLPIPESTTQRLTKRFYSQIKRPLSLTKMVLSKVKLHFIKRLFKRQRLPYQKPTIVFESFGGRQVSDSPLAVYQVFKQFYPGYNLIWSIYPELKSFCREHGMQYVVRNSVEWVSVMRRAQSWVSNARYPSWVKKSKFTFYLQTWHGTPLKKLGLDIKQVTMPGTDTLSYHRNFTREANRWDALISPNDYSTNIFRSAFGYKNQILKIGYPRNDELINTTADQIKALKEKMGIPQDKKVVLYAPTYRDNSFITTGKYTFKLPFSLQKFQEQYGKDTILILRMHYLIANQIDVSDFKDCVLNLSDYPNISELYLVSDLLITDYSSVFFDYAYLKRPILFYPYDYEMYKNELRGFYLDYEHELPGKIVHSEADMFTEMKNALTHADMTNNERFQQFYDRFCAINSGDSSRKVVDYIINTIKK